MPRTLRLLADDLTGALDSAAAFGTLDSPVPVTWKMGNTLPHGPLAFDTGTREADPRRAAETVKRVASPLFALPDALAYKKVDSLLRGSEAEEIAAVLEHNLFSRCVIAPAFPAQGRVSRGGRQGMAMPDGRWEALRTDLAARLEEAGHAVARCDPGDPMPLGVSFWNSESDADLDMVAAAASHGEGILFVGSGGLAAALARRFVRPHEAAAPPRRGPLLGLFGTDHPVMLAQLEAVTGHRLVIETADHADAVQHLLQTTGTAFVTVALPDETPRATAAIRIGQVLGELATRLAPPGTLMVAGGETLRGLCEALGTQRLDVVGEIMPGIPRSRLVGGRWDGTDVISKSGAFGAPSLLATLLAADTPPLSGATLP
ncbi:four-carbon acid sugar kinase family protein [Aureimonas psammosilenae]|uniref:four-carbon acid sugar kinase family protein n=1 Tax=Aureimonas psammosilenae TaxID=2495496 RepID=UPI001260C221|nr:four-carbon acid sugar kinase family protein [Aureimonas psammosilenae]